MTAPPDILVDLRCLQDPAYRDRGIGRHARAMLAGARGASGFPASSRLIGLIDATLPTLAARDLALVDACRCTADTGAMRRPVWFVEPSPMTHDPLAVARLAGHKAVFSAAAVYDLIPLEEPDRYLATPDRRLAYHVALFWLARYPLLLPISAATARRVNTVLGIPPGRMVVTGAPVLPCFEAATGQAEEPRHVLVVGGDDARKSVACAVRAHARTPALQAGRVPLLITGLPQEAERAQLRRLAGELGGDASLLAFPSGLDDAALAALYRQSLAVVSPSRAEGLSLPLAEAIASGVPAVAADIPAQREVVGADDLLFAPDDDLGLALILQRLAILPAYRGQAIATQALAGPRYREKLVAAKFWGAIAARAAAFPLPLAAPALPCGARPAVALLTPLPPERTGCADYTAAMCAALGARAELHLFTDTAAPRPIEGARAIRPLSALPALSPRFDRVVGVIGNAPYHATIFELLLRFGGTAVAHDSWLLAFYRSQLGLDRTLREAARELGRAVTEAEVAGWLAEATSAQPTMLGELAAAADPLCVHSASAADLLAERLGRRPVALPFCIYRPFAEAELTAAARRAARQRLGLLPATLLVASFGFVNRTKRPRAAVATLAALRRSRPEVELRFVGAGEPDAGGLQGVAEQHGVAAQVRLPGPYFDEAIYRDHLLAADVGLQLRRGFPGSLSGALMDCIAAGLPTVASASLVEAIGGPPCVTIVADEAAPEAIAAALLARVELGRDDESRRAFAAARSPTIYAERLCAALGFG